MRATLSRLVDKWIDRGAGLDAKTDPFGPPLPLEETTRALDVVRRARFEGTRPPFETPFAVEGTPSTVPCIVRPPRQGHAWCLLATPYGAFTRPGRLGLYEVQARALAARGFGVASIEPPFHGARAMPGRPSGWGFVRADLGHTMRSVVAYASEVAALTRHLREHLGAERVTGLALSMGGCALGLASTHEAPVEKLAFLAAADNPASFYATGENREARRHTLTAAGFDIARVGEAFRPIAPSTYGPAPQPALFAIPQQDLVVPAASQDAWRAAWNAERLDMSWEGHGIALASPVAAQRIASWLAEA